MSSLRDAVLKGSGHVDDSEQSLPTLTRDERAQVRSFMEGVLARSGVSTVGPIASAVDALQECLQGVVEGTLELRKQRVLEEQHEAESRRLEAELGHAATEALSQIRKKGGQPGNTNALKHALTGQRFFLTEGEDAGEFEALKEAYFAMLKPANAGEAQMVTTIVEETWRCQRARALDCAIWQRAVLRGDGDPSENPVEERLANLARYQRSLTISLDKAIKRFKMMRELSELSERAERSVGIPPKDDPAWQRRPMTAREILDEPSEPSERSDDSDLSGEEVAPGDVPLEEVIQAFERMNVPFAMSDLLEQGYRFHDPGWEGYRSPMDLDSGR